MTVSPDNITPADRGALSDSINEQPAEDRAPGPPHRQARSRASRANDLVVTAPSQKCRPATHHRAPPRRPASSDMPHTRACSACSACSACTALRQWRLALQISVRASEKTSTVRMPANRSSYRVQMPIVGQPLQLLKIENRDEHSGVYAKLQ